LVIVNEISKHIYVIDRVFLLIAADTKAYVLCCNNQNQVFKAHLHLQLCSKCYAQTIKTQGFQNCFISNSSVTVCADSGRFWHAKE